MRKEDSSLGDWKTMSKRFEENIKWNKRDEFKKVVFILTKWIKVNKVNISMLKSLNQLVTKINAVHKKKMKLNGLTQM